MNAINIWDATANVQTITALILIIILLMYIAFQLSNKRSSRNTR